MKQIIWEQCLEKDDILLCAQIVKEGPNSFMFSEGPVPPNVAGISPRFFDNEETAMRFAKENYMPGRKTFGWQAKLPELS